MNGSMPAQASNLFRLEDLEDPSRTAKLAESDLSALRTVADWIETFVARPHKDLLAKTASGKFFHIRTIP